MALTPSERPAPQRPRIIAGYAHAMKLGQWRVTHQPIALDTKLRPIDGQHRLMAVLEYGKPVKMTVAFNCNYSFGAPVDLGAKRSLGDILKRTSKDMAVSGCLIRFFDRELGVSSGKLNVSPNDVLRAERRYRGLARVFEAHRASKSPRQRAAIFAGFAYAWDLNPEVIERTMMQFLTGENITSGMPAYALRTFCEGAAGARLPFRDAHAVAVCILAALAGDNQTHIKTVTTGALEELRDLVSPRPSKKEGKK